MSTRVLSSTLVGGTTMLSRTTAQRFFFASTPVTLGVSPFRIFLKTAAKDPRLHGLPVRKRGNLLGKWYRALSTSEKRKLVAIAKTTKHTQKKKIPKKRTAHAFAKFVAELMKTPDIRKTPVAERMKVIAVKWREQKAAV